MSTYENTYCNTTTDLLFIEPNLAQYDHKTTLASNFTTTGTSDLYQLNNTGYVGQLYKDGVEMTSVADTPNADNEYNYSLGSLEEKNVKTTDAYILNDYAHDKQVESFLDKFNVKVYKQFFYLIMCKVYLY